VTWARQLAFVTRQYRGNGGGAAHAEQGNVKCICGCVGLAADVKAKKGQTSKYETKPEFTVGETFFVADGMFHGW
jgi:hypothetical protein